MTGRHEFLYVKKTYADWFKTSYRLTTEQSGVAGTTPAAQPPKAVDKTSPPAAQENKETKANARGKKRLLPQPEQPKEADSAASKNKKELDLFFRKLKSMKQEMSISITRASNILGLIDRDPHWQWASGPASAELREVPSC